MAYHLKCNRCGHRYDGARRIARCRQVAGPGQPGVYVRMPGESLCTYRCWGAMTKIVRRKRVPRDTAERLAHAERKLAEAIRRAKLAMTVVGRWQQRVKRLTAKSVAEAAAARIVPTRPGRLIRREELP